ncbi:MAG: hypothetical protein O7J95_20580 [Planctomycetota bacterium]|nr:hypothetical protein [Planctomycetota bacterium]
MALHTPERRRSLEHQAVHRLRAIAPLGVVACALLSVAVGCDDSSGPSSIQSDLQNSAFASIDARGGDMRPTTQLQGQGDILGDGGSGGDIRVISAGGDILLSSSSLTAVPEAPVLAGVGLDVTPGATTRVAGLREVDFLRVQAGGTLLLTDNTTIVVTGGVDISGSIRCERAATRADGNNLTVTAGGIVNVSGLIDCSGLSNVSSEDGFFLSGGNGGEILIFARNLAVTPGPHLFVSGVIRSNGGDADNHFDVSVSTRPGDGGALCLGTSGILALSGKLLARGGRGVPSLQESPGDGGRIDVTAGGDILVGDAASVSAQGGDSTALRAGLGGKLTLEAPIGIVSVDGTDLVVRGGNVEFTANSTAGFGGELTIYGDSVVFDNCLLNLDGGGITRGTAQDLGDPGGIGSAAGSAQIAVAGIGLPSVPRVMSFSSTTDLRAVGGDSNFFTSPGGQGGDVMFVNLEEFDPFVIDFQGTLQARGGVDGLGVQGADGVVCVRGASVPAIDRISAFLNEPPSFCGLTVDGFITGARFTPHDLDCDLDSIIPGSVTVTSPAVTGIDFFRVQVGAAVEVTIFISGADGSDLDLFAGDEGVLRSLNEGSYVFASATPGSIESVTIDLAAFSLGAFVSVMVAERGFLAQTYTISVSCTLP